MSFKTGYVTIIGKPNVGKSSLLNALIGEKVSITSPKPQTTRNNILGILNQPEAQIVFIDTPGMHTAQNKLDTFMQKSISGAKSGCDVLIYVLDGTKPITGKDIDTIKSLEHLQQNIILVVNKTDATTYEKLYPQLSKVNELSFLKDIIPLSALKRSNLQVLVQKIVELLPEGKPQFETDIYTTKSVKFMVGEIVREKALWVLQQEIPHGIGVEIIRFEEGDVTHIDADIICEKPTHKQIIIGKGGSVLKEIGTKARMDMETLLGTKVFLTLYVKVRDDWRNNETAMSNLGYGKKDE